MVGFELRRLMQIHNSTCRKFTFLPSHFSVFLIFFSRLSTRIQDSALRGFRVGEVEESFDVFQDKRNGIMRIRRFQQVFEIGNPGDVFPQVAPWFLCLMDKMPHFYVVPEK